MSLIEDRFRWGNRIGPHKRVFYEQVTVKSFDLQYEDSASGTEAPEETAKRKRNLTVAPRELEGCYAAADFFKGTYF
jgi:hypothetical protein